MRIMESRAQMRKEKTMDRIGGATGLVRRLMLGSIVLLASISLLAGCGRQQAESPESSSSADVADRPDDTCLRQVHALGAPCEGLDDDHARPHAV